MGVLRTTQLAEDNPRPKMSYLAQSISRDTAHDIDIEFKATI